MSASAKEMNAVMVGGIFTELVISISSSSTSSKSDEVESQSTMSLEWSEAVKERFDCLVVDAFVLSSC